MVSWARALVAKTAAAAREAKMDFMVVEESVDDGGQTRDERVVTWKKTTGGKKGQRSNYKPTSLLFTHKQAITKACPHGIFYHAIPCMTEAGEACSRSRIKAAMQSFQNI